MDEQRVREIVREEFKKITAEAVMQLTNVGVSEHVDDGKTIKGINVIVGAVATRDKTQQNDN